MSMNVLVGVSGGIAAYKAADLVSGLVNTGHDVKVVMTEKAQEFIAPLTLEALSHNVVLTDDEEWAMASKIGHIEYAAWADAFIMYPATANMIAKMAHGIADEIVSTTFLALTKKAKIIFVCPAANTNMWNKPVVKENMSRLSSLMELMYYYNLSIKNKLVLSHDRFDHLQYNSDSNLYSVLGPVEGKMACGTTGMGKVVSPRKVVEIYNHILSKIYNSYVVCTENGE